MSSSKAALAAAALALLLTGCGAQERQAMIWDGASATGAGPETAAVETTDISRAASGEASVIYPVRQKVSCALKNASLKELCISKGDSVSEGDVLAVVTVDYSPAELLALENKLTETQLEFELREQTLEQKLEELTGTGQIAELEREKLELEQEYVQWQKERELESCRAAIDDFKAAIGDIELKAPMSGVVSDMSYLSPGRLLEPDMVLCEIYDPSVCFLTCQTDVLGAMRYNEPVSIQIAREEEPIAGRIISAPSLTGQALGTVTVLPSPTEEQRELLAPDRKSRLITIVADRFRLEGVTALPLNAVENESGSRYVYLYEDGMAKKRYIAVGLSGGGLVQVLSGLEPGQTVIG